MTWLRRIDLEDRELRRLCRWATPSRDAGGRRLPEGEDAMRTAFQRDRDRVIHCAAFRRLQHKTQVVAAFEGDHFRSRMIHSLEVAQIARGASTALRLNPDLAEVIALAHDLGHPPFGHIGEECLHDRMSDHGGFRHNAQGTRIVDVLERRYEHGLGLNLTLAVRRSLLKGPVPDGFPVATDLLPQGQAPVEARLVDRCDRIAYICHDLDDGIRLGLMAAEELDDLELGRAARARLANDHPSRLISEMIAVLIDDLITTANARLDAPGNERPRIEHSDAVSLWTSEALEFLRTRFYRSERVMAVMNEGCDKIRSVFDRWTADPSALPERHRGRIDDHGIERVVCDYIAGMTDRYLLGQ